MTDDYADFTGWASAQEDEEYLRAAAQPFALTYGDFEAPDEIDPRNLLKVENQQSQGSCAGHANSTIAELCRAIQTGEPANTPKTQFSRQFAYLEAQRYDRLLGRDSGSTISGGLKVGKEIGYCPESLCPYPSDGRYPRNARSYVTDEMRQAADEFKIRRHSWLKDYDGIFNWIAAGQGGVFIGVTWNSSCTPGSDGRLESVRTRSGGGHAVALVGYLNITDRNGRKYLILANSWARRWGRAGYAIVAHNVIDQWSESRNSRFVGMSDISGVEPRKVDFDFVNDLEM